MTGASLHLVVEQARLGFRWDLSFIDPARRAARAHSVALRAPAGERYSLDPVVRRARLRGIENVSDLAVWLGVSRETVYRWQRSGGVDWRTADRIACHLNLHPSALWPEWSLDPDLIDEVAS